MSARTTTKITDMSAFEDAMRDRLRHKYPADPRYRRSGARVPQIGDIAYCGHVKEIPYTNGASASWPLCPNCARLKGLAS